MFKYGKRTVIKQGESYLISLPMQWLRSMDSDVKAVVVEMDCENRLRITAGDTLPDTTDINN
jgi:adenylate kinase